jgi:hypothetical protein
VQCGEFEEQISAAVDERLCPGDADDFRVHATLCLRCQFEFEMEACTKRIVRKTLPPVPVPPGLVERILQFLEGVADAPPPR